MANEPVTPQNGEGAFPKAEWWSAPRIGIFAVLLVACALSRLLFLGHKAIMHDESLFVYYTYDQLYENWNYFYMPILHGPAMLHIQNIVFHIFGASDYTMRLGAALLGVGGFLWIFSLRPWLGEKGVWFALAFYTVAPGISFYQRFFRNDSLFLFATLWVVASLAHWWRTRNPRWGASAIFAITVLFCNKESSLFVYFSVLTFFVLVVLNDLISWLFEGKDPRLQGHLEPAPKFPGPFWFVLVLGGFIVLALTQTFEGAKYDADVVRTLGHDWVLKDVRSIPLALGWTERAQTTGDVGAVATSGFWRKVYAALIIGLLVVGAVIKAAVDVRIGRREVLTRFWRMVYGARWYLIGSIVGGIALYLAIFTTFFKHEIGPFEIYKRTWAYWGGQHEWGRIGGPFHQHLLNILLYELPMVLIVAGAWLYGMFKIKWTRTTAIAFFLVAVAAAGFHVMFFSGLEWKPPGTAVPVEMDIEYLKNIFLAGILFGIAVFIFPAWGRFLLPLAFAGLVGYSIVYFDTSQWSMMRDALIFKDGEPVMMMKRHVTMKDYVEIKSNFDYGWNLALVLCLVLFATFLSWNAIQKGERFHAFLIWWFVTSYGAASYAREAVPWIGIHSMLPLILLGSSYINKWDQAGWFKRRPVLVYGLLGFFILWNAKAAFNLNFRNPDDVRERMVYGHTPQDVKNHADMVTEYQKIANIRTEGQGRPEWLAYYNDKKRLKDVRVCVKSDPVGWQLRWYLRDVDWTEYKDPAEAIDENWEFLFLEPGAEAQYTGLTEKYHVVRGRGRVFWTPSVLGMEQLGDIWKEWIPGHYLDQSPQAGEAYNAKQEWKRLWRYMIMREVFEGYGRSYPAISSSDYIFCWRKDLF